MSRGTTFVADGLQAHHVEALKVVGEAMNHATVYKRRFEELMSTLTMPQNQPNISYRLRSVIDDFRVRAGMERANWTEPYSGS